ncbi:MAG: hypothetical protein JW940_22380 [Polyangiaceae bacterium]|nr:hypothetical protein [Polyangiaceae bacterium]
MWVRRSAIRPVPPYARVPEHAMDQVRGGLAEDDEEARAQLDQAFERFERRQPVLAAHVAHALGSPLDETALALGYFLALAVWLGFERAHGDRVTEIETEEIEATEELLTLDEQLRRADPADALDSDDVIAMEQPHLLNFVHEHVTATLDAHADDIDVDDVHAVYRVILVQILALSYAVQLPTGYPVGKTELMA